MHESSQFLRNEPCPKCRERGKDRKGNNLGVYSDGHKWCWSCGYLNNPVLNRISGIKDKPVVITQNNPVKLPSDISIDYPQKVIDWIVSYELTIEDLHKNNALWSSVGVKTKSHGQVPELLIFPVWQNEQLVLWTGRYFGEEEKPKWIMRGDNKSVVHLINKYAKYIVIVEDIVSGIKIANSGKDYGALVLFNSHNPVNKLKQIGKGKRYFIWLDNDKFKESILFAREAVSHKYDIKIITSERDPKDVSYKAIKELLCKT